MLQDRYEPDKLFASILSLTNEMDPVLAQIDQLLEDEVLYQLIRQDLAQRYPHTERTGRRSTPVEVLLRMLAVKRLYGLSYEQTEYQVRDSLVLRQFCRLYLNAVPDDTTLIRWANLIQPQSLARFNARLTALATELKVTRGRKLRTDGTVVESNIHPPSDSSLLADSVRVLGRTLQRAKTVLVDTPLAPSLFRNRIRSVRKSARQVGETMRRGGETARQQGHKAYRKLLQATQATVDQAEQVLSALEAQPAHAAQRLANTLQSFIPRAKQVIEQTQRRVFAGEQVPAAEKLVSLFEPHSDIIRRNKAHKPTEYGHKVWLDEVEGGIVSHWRVLAGNPPDHQQLLPSLENHLAHFGQPPEQLSADRGVYTAANEQSAQQQGVKRLILPKSGKKTEARTRYEHQPWFVRGRKWHVGVEGRISVLKRRFELDRCRDHGLDNFDKWVGWGVIASNLTVIARKVRPAT